MALRGCSSVRDHTWFDVKVLPLAVRLLPADVPAPTTDTPPPLLLARLRWKMLPVNIRLPGVCKASSKPSSRADPV